MTMVSRRVLALRLLPALAGVLATGCGSGRPIRLPGRIGATGRIEAPDSGDAPERPARARGGAAADPDIDLDDVRIRLANGRVVNLDLDDYVAGSLLAEAALGGLDPATARAVAEVQAIVARTYAIANRRRHARDGFHLCATTHCQVYRPASEWPQPLARLARDAAAATRGAVILHAGRPINAVFHADCGGHTSAASTAWRGASPPYLQGRPDPWCVREGRPPWRAEIALRDLQSALNRNDATKVGRSLDRVEVSAQDAAGRAVEVTLHGSRTVAVRGERLRSAINAGVGKHVIRSTRFSVRRSGRSVVFEGRGFGHGVGLCQIGATGRARAGHAPRDIIAHYYAGATVSG